MPKLERQDWRPDDASQILQDARVVGRAQGSREDNSRFDGLILEVKTVTPNPKYVPPASDLDTAFTEPESFTQLTLYVAYWVSGHFLVELYDEGHEFICETCGEIGIVGKDGPRYGVKGSQDRDPRDQSLPRCDQCLGSPTEAREER